jgi:hypothetical protein
MAFCMLLTALPLFSSQAAVADTTYCYFEAVTPHEEGGGAWMEGEAYQECFDEMFDNNAEACLYWANLNQNTWWEWGCTSNHADWLATFQSFEAEEWEWCGDEFAVYDFVTRAWWRNMDHHAVYIETGHWWSPVESFIC